jgi:hypothetical protein
MPGAYWANNQYFNPRQVTNLTGWFDANDPKANGTKYVAGASVSLWNDKSPSPNNAAQGSSGQQPLYELNQVNGLPAMVCNGSSLMQGTSTLGSNPTFACFAVTKATSLPAGTNDWYALGTSASVGGVTGLGMHIPGSAENWSIFDYGGMECEVDNTDTNPHVLTTTRISNVPLMYVDGVIGISSGSSITMNVNTTFNIGSGALGGWPGLICEIVMYNGVVSSAQTALVQQYLKNKWL